MTVEGVVDAIHIPDAGKRHSGLFEHAAGGCMLGHSEPDDMIDGLGLVDPVQQRPSGFGRIALTPESAFEAVAEVEFTGCRKPAEAGPAEEHSLPVRDLELCPAMSRIIGSEA